MRGGGKLGLNINAVWRGRLRQHRRRLRHSWRALHWPRLDYARLENIGLRLGRGRLLRDRRSRLENGGLHRLLQDGSRLGLRGRRLYERCARDGWGLRLRGRRLHERCARDGWGLRLHYAGPL